MRYTPEELWRESFERFPPSWGDTVYGEDDEADDEQDQKKAQCQRAAKLKTGK
jgi:hypothetical protein